MLVAPLDVGARDPAEEALLAEFTELENGVQPQGARLRRVEALARQVDPASSLQGRLVRLQCWALPAETSSDYSAAITFASKALLQARQEGDRVTESALLICRGWHNQLLGEMARARLDYDLALSLARAAGEQRLEADALGYRGGMLAYQGGLAAGLRDQLVAHDLYERLGLERGRLKLMGEIANTYRRMGVFDRAQEYFKALEQAYEQQGDAESLTVIRAQLAILYTETERYGEALTLFEEAANHFKASGARMDEAWALTEVAHSLLKLNRREEARARLQQADALLSRDQETDAATLGQWRLVMGLLEEARGDLDRALYFLALAEPIFRQEDNQRFLATIYRVQSRILERQGQADAALKTLRHYVTIQESLEHQLGEQRSIQMRFEFDLARKEAENEALKSQQALQTQQLDRLQERRHWQTLVTVLGLLLLGGIVLFLLGRSRKLRRLAMTDELTGIHNRRQIQAKGEAMLAQDQPCSLLLIDIDHFKQINDGWGHHAGDRVLVAVAERIAAELRSLDRVGRNGGEEFLVLLPDTTLGEAGEVAERIRTRVAGLRVEALPADHPIRVSIGCAEYRPGESLTELVHRADEAMYRAKETGRDRVCLAD
ncbi:diguanylate cyclase [Aeromonas crassostreae]